MQITIEITHEDILKARANQTDGYSYITIIHPSGLEIELEDMSAMGKDSQYSVAEVRYTFKEHDSFDTSAYLRYEAVNFASINIHLPEIWAYREKDF